MVKRRGSLFMGGKRTFDARLRRRLSAFRVTGIILACSTSSQDEGTVTGSRITKSTYVALTMTSMTSKYRLKLNRKHRLTQLWSSQLQCDNPNKEKRSLYSEGINCGHHLQKNVCIFGYIKPVEEDDFRAFSFDDKVK